MRGRAPNNLRLDHRVDLTKVPGRRFIARRFIARRSADRPSTGRPLSADDPRTVI
jgi:hypothetical protein